MGVSVAAIGFAGVGAIVGAIVGASGATSFYAAMVALAAASDPGFLGVSFGKSVGAIVGKRVTTIVRLTIAVLLGVIVGTVCGAMIGTGLGAIVGAIGSLPLYLPTMLLFNLWDWRVVAVFWLLWLAAYGFLWRRGAHLQRQARNPLYGLLEQGMAASVRLPRRGQWFGPLARIVRGWGQY
jgi:hypothetical protein